MNIIDIDTIRKLIRQYEFSIDYIMLDFIRLYCEQYNDLNFDNVYEKEDIFDNHYPQFEKLSIRQVIEIFGNEDFNTHGEYVILRDNKAQSIGNIVSDEDGALDQNQLAYLLYKCQYDDIIQQVRSEAMEILIQLQEDVKLNQQISTQDKILINIFDKYKLILPDTHKSIQKITTIVDDEEFLEVLDSKSRKSKMRIGRTLKSIFPQVQDHIIQKISKQIVSTINQNIYEIKQFSDVTQAYSLIYSCMRDKPWITQFYNQQDNISVLLLYKDNKPVARALKWTNVDGAKNNTYIDRVYPADRNQYRNVFEKYAKDNNFSYYSKHNKDSMEYEIQTKLDDIYKIPYMDTFEYYDSEYHYLCVNNNGQTNMINCKNTEGTSPQPFDISQYKDNLQNLPSYIKDQLIDRVIQYEYDNYHTYAWYLIPHLFLGGIRFIDIHRNITNNGDLIKWLQNSICDVNDKYFISDFNNERLSSFSYPDELIERLPQIVIEVLGG